MVLDQSANLEYNLYHIYNSWYIHQHWILDCWEIENVYCCIQVVNCWCVKLEITQCHRVAEVAFQTEVWSGLISAVYLSIVVVMHQFLCTLTTTADCLQYHFARKAAIWLLFTNHSHLSSLRSHHISNSMTHNCLLPLLFDSGIWIRHVVLHCLYCSSRTPCFCHFAHIKGEVHVGLF